nr:unnamed protein product [Callosobruchus chinensis]
MFHRFTEIKEPLCTTLANLNIDSVRNPTNEEWQVIERVCEILKPFEEDTQHVSSEKAVTISKIFIFSNALLKHYSSNMDFGNKISSKKK